jgi:hypothetical protein
MKFASLGRFLGSFSALCARPAESEPILQTDPYFNAVA